VVGNSPAWPLSHVKVTAVSLGELPLRGHYGATMDMLDLAKRPNLLLTILVPLLAMAALFPHSASAGQIASAAYFHLRQGMSESEVLVRAGPPDLVTSPGVEAVEVKHGLVERGDDGEVTFDSFRRTRIPTLSRWHYVPGPGETDPFITIVTFRAGEVWEIERTKVFSRYKPGSSGSASGQGPATATDIQRQRADNTLKAAEAYAATRAKLKEQAGDEAASAAPDRKTTIYKGVQPDGSTYFGDSPPGESPEVISVD